jgi:hypothetical protein
MNLAKLAKTAIASLALITLTPNNVTARPPRTSPPLRYALPAGNGGGCEIYYQLQPVDPTLLKLLGTPAVPTNSSLLSSPEYIQQRDWDFPSKVTPWSQRPKPEEIAQRREQLAGTSAADAANQKSNAIPNWALWNYGLEPFTQHDWSDLQKWFAKELPKKVPGACVDPQKADHVLVVGVIVLGAGGPVDSSGARIQYGQTVGQTETTVGPNSGISPAVGTHRASQELGTSGDSPRKGAHACAYLFRATAAGAARIETPEDYYCRSSGEEPRAAISAILKYIATPAKN